ncbi:MAG: hypothetical protein NT062_16850, partial [Proteobacteria bacterium]|nr:hypothetical protein [Pseudomonadota bacterium]
MSRSGGLGELVTSPRAARRSALIVEVASQTVGVTRQTGMLSAHVARRSRTPRTSPFLATQLADEVSAACRETGESLVASVQGTMDVMGGVRATVSRSVAQRDRVYDVVLMPSLHEPDGLLVACTCSPSLATPCAHTWAVLRAIDLRRVWPDELVVPRWLDATDPDDPDLELVDEDGVRFIGTALDASSPSSTTALVVTPPPR